MQNWVKSPSLVLQIWCSQGFLVISCDDPDLWPQNLIGTSMNPNTSLTKIGYNSLQWLLRYGVYKVFGTHRLSDWLTDGHPHRECLLRRSNDGGYIKISKHFYPTQTSPLHVLQNATQLNLWIDPTHVHLWSDCFWAYSRHNVALLWSHRRGCCSG